MFKRRRKLVRRPQGTKVVDRGGFTSAIGDMQRALAKARRTSMPYVANLGITAREEAEFNREIAKLVRAITKALREFGINTRTLF